MKRKLPHHLAKTKPKSEKDKPKRRADFCPWLCKTQYHSVRVRNLLLKFELEHKKILEGNFKAFRSVISALIQFSLAWKAIPEPSFMRNQTEHERSARESQIHKRNGGNPPLLPYDLQWKAILETLPFSMDNLLQIGRLKKLKFIKASLKWSNWRRENPEGC